MLGHLFTGSLCAGNYAAPYGIIQPYTLVAPLHHNSPKAVSNGIKHIDSGLAIYNRQTNHASAWIPMEHKRGISSGLWPEISAGWVG
ncbi:hypothetical protein AVEN_194977-1 [Araneus ventricosus]|uniref:Uncharacterized protein n=1 Tax=Araneus ventricosus TaxID=182803 RepID=A0A4Y2R3C6_ARAVE|nr:hypothetical protein AVEN_194977-1 [Araneus ventricosus]